MAMKKRWRLVIKNIKGDPIAEESFWTRWGAHRQGDAITSPPLNYYRVEKANVPWRRD